MDYQSLLYDPIYLAVGCDATLTFVNGDTFPVRALDKTAGVETGETVQGSTILPAAVLRMAEVLALGVAATRFADKGTTLTLNGFIWDVKSYRMRPSPIGENDGEIYLMLSGQKVQGVNMKPASYNFTVVRGSVAADLIHSPLVLTFKRDGVVIPYDKAQLSVYSGAPEDTDGELLFRVSTEDGGLVEDGSSGVTFWKTTKEQTRALALGRNNYYEVELFEGSSQQVYIAGIINGQGGLNQDV